MSDLHVNPAALHQAVVQTSALQIPFESQCDGSMFSYSGQTSPPLLAVLSLLC